MAITECAPIDHLYERLGLLRIVMGHAQPHDFEVAYDTTMELINIVDDLRIEVRKLQEVSNAKD